MKLLVKLGYPLITDLDEKRISFGENIIKSIYSNYEDSVMHLGKTIINTDYL